MTRWTLCLLIVARAGITHANPSTEPERHPLPRAGDAGDASVAAWLATCTLHGEPLWAPATPWPWIVPVERHGLTDACRAQFRALERAGRGDELHRALDQACTDRAAACYASEAIRRERLAPLYVLCGELGGALCLAASFIAQRRRRRSLRAGGRDS